MFAKTPCRLAALPALLALVLFTTAFRPPEHATLPNLDKRSARPADAAKKSAVQSLRASAPEVSVETHPVTGGAAFVTAKRGFLSEAEGQSRTVSKAAWGAIPKNDPHRPTKAFLQQHRALFGHGPEALAAAELRRDFVTAHNGVRTVTWEQRVDGVPVFDAVFISHTTAKGELVSVASHFVSDSARAALQAKARPVARLTAAAALRLAADNLSVTLVPFEIQSLAATEGVEQKQRFTARGLAGEATAELAWLPMSKDELRLCWNFVLKPRGSGETFRVLVDATNGEVLLRRGLTAYLTNATYRVFTSDSPTPLSPGHATPLTNQPAEVGRSLLTLAALNTNASPASWIATNVNETFGNNVDAHLDLNADDAPDLPRPQGSPHHVFDFALDLTQAPSSYASASVVQLFYWCNWAHDRLYELGFTEAAGNFQVNNFGRGGAGNDAVLADAQDGEGFNNANMLTLPDGIAPRMQMYLFNGPDPDRDGSFDAEIVLHEYVHGLSNRRVGGGVGISELQTVGMGEGWSDFYALALLSEPGDDVNGTYALGAYATRQFLGLAQNYYYGIRRYPYSTDLLKNPLTFKDIDPAQADPHSGVSISPVGGGSADEVHNMGEVWCAMLWEARANLINKHGWTNGNQLILQLVTDGMNLSPANPNFVQARDAIIQADLLNNSGANFVELWAAFAKRGLGASAQSPESSTTVGLVEAYDPPDPLALTPFDGFIASGPVGGPFSVTAKNFTLFNSGTNALNWLAATNVSWLSASPSGGTLATGASVVVTVALTPAAALQPTGIYAGAVRFTNLTTGVGQARSFLLRAGQPDLFTELFTGDFDLANSALTFTPDGSPSFYRACRETVTNFFTDPTGGTALSLTDDSFSTRTISGGTVSLYGRSTNVVHVGSNGHITFDSGDTDYTESTSDHFALPRVAALFRDLNPAQGGTVYWQEFSNRVAATWLGVPEYGAGNNNTFQIEMFFDGRVRVTWLQVDAVNGLAGLSSGQGLPFGFDESNLSVLTVCGSGALFLAPIDPRTEGEGTVINAGLVTIPFSVPTNLTVALTSSDTTELTVPTSVVIVAGQTNAAFDITVTDDAQLDGSQSATITATASAFTIATRTVAVHDNENTTLIIHAPTPISEGVGSVPATLTVSAPVATNVTVQLASSDTSELQVPATAVLLSGQTSAVFSLTVVDDLAIDGAQPVTLTATVTNWTPGATNLVVTDNDTLQLDLLLDLTEAFEGAGVLTNAALVSIGGTLPTNLVVVLDSSDLTELTVPPTVTVLAGETFARFNLTVVDDALLDGTQTVFLTAESGDIAPGFNAFLVNDDETPPFPPSNPSPAHLAANVIANTALAWSAASGTNDVYFGTVNPPGAAQFLGTTTGTNWTLPLLAPDTVYYWRVVSRRLGTNAGPVWKFTTRGVHHFAFSSVVATQYAGLPFPLTITAQDEFNTTVSNFSGTVALSAGGGTGELFRTDFESGLGGLTLDNSLGDGSGLWRLTTALANDPGHSPSNSLYYGKDEGTHGNGNYNTGAANEGAALLPPLALASLTPPVTLRFHHLAQTEVSTNYDHATVEISTNNGATWRVVAARWFTTNGWPNDFAGAWRTQTVDLAAYAGSTNARLRFRFDTVDGQANNHLGWYLDDVRVQGQSLALPMTPTNATFTGGVWNNTAAVLVPTSNVVLTASYAGGATGQSAPFLVLAPPRLSVAQAGAQVIVTWPAVPGRAYRVQAKSVLENSWTNLAPDFVATGATLSFTNTPPPVQMFYRVQLLP